MIRVAGNRALQVAGLLVALASPWQVAAGEWQFGARIAPEWRRWSYGVPGGEKEIRQTSIPLDLLITTGEIRGEVGADFVRGRHESTAPRDAAAGASSLEEVSALRLGVQAPLFAGAAIVSLRHVQSLSAGDLTADEVVVAEGFEPLALEFARPRPFGGSTTTAGFGAQIARGARWVWTGALSGELRGESELLSGGPRFDPGDRWLGATALAYSPHARGPRAASGATSRIETTVRASLRAGGSGASRVDGETLYHLGRQIGAGVSAETQRGADRFRAQIDLIATERGTVAEEGLIAPASVRGGNRTAVTVEWRRAFGSWSALGALDGRVLRGFSGDLGHSEWIAPRLGVGRSFGPASARLEVARPVGHARSSRRLDGALVRLVLSHGIAL